MIWADNGYQMAATWSPYEYDDVRFYAAGCRCQGAPVALRCQRRQTRRIGVTARKCAALRGTVRAPPDRRSFLGLARPACRPWRGGTMKAIWDAYRRFRFIDLPAPQVFRGNTRLEIAG